MTNAAAVASVLLRDLASVDPDAAEAMGDSPHLVMPALGPANFEQRYEARRRALADLRARHDASHGDGVREEVVLATVLEERLSSELALDDSGFTRALLAPLATPVHQVREVFDNLPHETPEQWQRVADHLALVPTALGAYLETLREAASRGHVVAARQVLVAATQCERWVDPDGDDFYRRLVSHASTNAAADGGAPSPAALASLAEGASAATRDFAHALRSELLPVAPQRDAVGRDRYAVTARAFLGDDVDLEETYAFGWEELARLTAEMQGLAGELGASSFEEAAARLDADPAQQLSHAQLLPWLQSRVHEVVAAVDGVSFDLPAVAREPECRLAAATSGVMYYTPPDASFSRPGRIWWAAPEDASSATWREVTTVHHEGVPGHHLQLAVALAEPGLHPWQRAFAHVHGYVEGWAHYAERLCDELGLLRTPGERLGMLYGQRWRAARIVIDMGLHLDLPIPAHNGFTDATSWSPELGVEVLRAASGASRTSAEFEVDRYLGWPAQALAFRVGARLWREIRSAAEEAAARRGQPFDLREFHMAALRLGPMGLAPLRELLLTGAS